MLDDWIGAVEAAVRAGEKILAQDAEVRILLVERICDARKQFKSFSKAEPVIQIHDGVTRHAAIRVLVVSIATGIDATAVYCIRPHGRMFVEIILQPHLHAVLRNAGNPITWLDRDIYFGVGARIVR